MADQRRRPARDARPAHAGLPPPAAALAGVLHASTRTGEIQSRIANDIGGVQNVVTCTAASIVSNVTTVVATRRRDVPARLAAGAVLPRAAAVLRPAGPPRRQPAAQDHDGQAGRDGRHVLARAGVAVGQRDPARQDDGPRRRARRPLRPRVREPRRPRGPLADGRPLDDGRDPDVVRGDAGARLPVRRARPGRGLDRHDRRLHHAADAAVLPGPVAALASASTSRPRRRCSTASSSTSTSPSTSSRARALWATCAARSASTASGSATATSGRCATSTSTVARRHAHRAGRRDRRGQDHARLPRGAALRPRAGRGARSTASTCAS